LKHDLFLENGKHQEFEVLYMRLTEEIRESGYFWLENTPKIKCPGNLSINDGGEIELEIIESPIVNFGQLAVASEQEFDIVSRIFGQTRKYSFVMLDDCQFFRKNVAMTIGGVSKSYYRVRMAFLNHMLENNNIAITEKEITTKQMCFSIEGLDEWIGPIGFEFIQTKSEPTSIIKYTRPEEISTVLENGMTLSIYFTHTTNFPFVGEVRLTNKAHYRLTSKDETGLACYISVARKIVELFSFFVDKTVSIEQVSINMKEIYFEAEDGKRVYKAINLYYQSSPFSKEPPKLSRFDTLLNYAQIKDNYSIIINNWLRAYERLEPALNLYFAAMEGAFTYLDSKFLALAQCLEVFDRRTSNRKVMDDTSFADIVQGLVNACPAESKEWLENKLQYANEISLNQRIRKIIDPFSEYFDDENERKRLARNISITRHYMTHYDESQKADAITNGNDLYQMYAKMEAIFRLYLLQILGFTQDEIRTIVAKSPSLRFKLNLQKELQ
jgi:hypothetical protein